MTLAYVPIQSPFGAMGLAWLETPCGPRVQRIYLPNELPSSFVSASCAPIAALAIGIEAYLRGQIVALGLDLLDMELCGEFQRRVLLAEHGIPRGCASTYGRIAAHLNCPRAARAVGTALGRNPFPIVIPCHRAVRSDGALGGYRGGFPMKRTLLEMEGVEFGMDGKVKASTFFY